MKTIGIIPARYKSVRFEGKVLADIFGRPMLQHVYENAKCAKLLDELLIATDDEEVEKIAKNFGANVILTSKGHLSGTDRLAEVVNPIDVNIVINIQADEPLIQGAMIDSLASALLEDNTVGMATLAKKIEDISEIENPNVVKVIFDKSNNALYFSRACIPFPHQKPLSGSIFYKHIGIYGYTKDFLFTFRNLPASNLEEIEKLEQLRVLENGYKIKVIETEFDTIGVDTPEDLEKVKERLRNKSR